MSKKAKKSSARSGGKKSKKQPLFAQKDFLSLKGTSPAEVTEILRLTAQIQKKPEQFLNKLRGKSLGLIFQKPSLRTRISFEVGMSQLGGGAIYLSDEEVQMGQREPLKDVARTLSRYFQAIVMRTFAHSEIEEFARYATVPVINGLSDSHHPCQVLSDLYTIGRKFGHLDKINITYIGDSNNVLTSMLYGASLVGANLSIVTPRGYEPSEEVLKDIKNITKDSGSKITLSNNPFMSLKNAHVIYTDVWVSMGQERMREQRLRDFQPLQVSQAIVSKALPDALVMHCLPARRGEEITDEVIEGGHSIVFEQAENKLYVQKALLTILLSRKKALWEKAAS